MQVVAICLIIFVALFHIQVFIMEAVLWQTPRARKAFGTTEETAAITQPLAINQGVYNLFLAAGLLLSLLLDDPARFQTQVFLLACVMIAALTAGLVVNKRLMLIQGLSALITLAAIIFSH